MDWIDQAALQLLLDPPPDGDVSSHPRTDRLALRRPGVRTAIDLENFSNVPNLVHGRHWTSWVASTTAATPTSWWSRSSTAFGPGGPGHRGILGPPPGIGHGLTSPLGTDGCGSAQVSS